MSRTEGENEKREKELLWDKQGGGKIDFGGHIGVIYFYIKNVLQNTAFFCLKHVVIHQLNLNNTY